MEPSSAPIGIYDSGLGGLTVWHALKQLVKQDLIYYGDTAHVPYGEKTKAQIVFYSNSIIEFLKSKQVKLIVAACNTSSALALPILQLSAGIPLFGVIAPAVEEGLAATYNHKIGLLATIGTIDSGSYQKRFSELAPEVELFPQKCPKLVPLIEAGKLEGAEVESALHEYLDPLLEQNIDTLILGCTHYPFLLKPIKKIIGSGITIIDPAWQTAKNVTLWLKEHNFVNSPGITKDEFWTSGEPQVFRTKASEFTGKQIEIVNYHQVKEMPNKYGEILSGDLSSAWRGEEDGE